MGDAVHLTTAIRGEAVVFQPWLPKFLPATHGISILLIPFYPGDGEVIDRGNGDAMIEQRVTKIMGLFLDDKEIADGKQLIKITRSRWSPVLDEMKKQIVGKILGHWQDEERRMEMKEERRLHYEMRKMGIKD